VAGGGERKGSADVVKKKGIFSSPGRCSREKGLGRGGNEKGRKRPIIGNSNSSFKWPDNKKKKKKGDRAASTWCTYCVPGWAGKKKGGGNGEGKNKKGKVLSLALKLGGERRRKKKGGGEGKKEAVLLMIFWVSRSKRKRNRGKEGT